MSILPYNFKDLNVNAGGGGNVAHLASILPYFPLMEDSVFCPNTSGAFADHGATILSSTITAFSFIFKIPKSGSITGATIFSVAASTPQPLTISLETLDASGNASGTNYGGSAPATIATPAANTTYNLTFATPATAVKGDYVALKVAWTGTTGSATFASFALTNRRLFPGANTLTSGVWNRIAAYTRQMNAVLIYSDASLALPFGATCVKSTSSAGISSASAVDEVGTIFNLTEKRVTIGAQLGLTYPAAILPFDVNLYSPAGALLSNQTITLPNSVISNQTGTNYYHEFAAPIELPAGDGYRLTVAPTTAVTTVIYHLLTFDSVAHKNLMFPAGTGVCTRADAGAWTDTFLSVTPINPVFSSITV